jgi:DNA-3-methyladenine glycosylase II
MDFDKDPAAVKHLRKADPVLADIIKRVGPPKLRPVAGGAFQSLGRAILYQQLAGAAAAAIEKRFMALYGDGRFPTPKELLKTSDEKLRSVGLSRQKTVYLKDLAAKILDGTINEAELPSMSDEDIIEHVTAVKGIGRWTAEMFLMFQLRRPDILPVDDLGVRNAFKRMYKLDEVPKPAQMIDMAESWRPYRSLGTWYLWQSFDFVLMGEDNRPRTRPSEA